MINCFNKRRLLTFSTLVCACMTSFTLLGQFTLDSIYHQNKQILNRVERLEKSLATTTKSAGNCDEELKKANAERALMQGEVKALNQQLQRSNDQLTEMQTKLSDLKQVFMGGQPRLPHATALKVKAAKLYVDQQEFNLAITSLRMDAVDSLLRVEPTSQVRLSLNKLSRELEKDRLLFSDKTLISPAITAYIQRVNNYCSYLKIFNDFVKNVSDTWIQELVAEHFLNLKTDFTEYPFLYQAQLGGLGIGSEDNYFSYLWMKSNSFDCK